MKKGLTIYIEDNTELARLFGTVYITKGEETKVKEVAFYPPDSGAVLIPADGDIMAVAEPSKTRKK